MAVPIIILGLLLLLNSAAAQTVIITLDQEADATGLWTDSSCHFMDHPDDFWVYGCPLNVPSSEVDSSSGFWSLCLPETTSCSMSFDAGLLPKAKTLRVRAFMEGSTNRIIITGKHSSNDLAPIFLNIISPGDDTPQWIDEEIELPSGSLKLSALTFTLNSQNGNGYILLDSISVELEDEPSLTVILDKQVDKRESHWTRDTCNYVENTDDLKYYGCPVQGTESGDNSDATGFWSPHCGYTSCKLEFYSGHGLIPKSIAIHAFLERAGEIRISIKRDPKSTDSLLVQTLNGDNSTTGWIETVVDLDEFPNHPVATIELVGSISNVVLLDTVSITVLHLTEEKQAQMETIDYDRPEISRPKKLFNSRPKILLPPPISISSRVVEITLDQESDVTGLWTDNSCHFVDQPEDFWVYGCPINNVPSDVELSSGYWSYCLPKTSSCSMTFDAGFLPKAKTVKVRAFIQGSSNTITITGKHSSNEIIPIFVHSIKTEDETPQWMEVEVPLPPMSSLSVLTITLNSRKEIGYILLDSVSIELEDEAIAVVNLDEQKDEIQSHWIQDTCSYVENYRDFKYYGCPIEEVTETDDENEVGFWSPCDYVSCRLEFFIGHGVNPSSLSIRAYFNGTGEIRVYTKLHPKSGSEDTHLVETLTVGNSRAGWVDTVVDLDEFPDHTVAVIELVGSGKNVALLDRISVSVLLPHKETSDPTTPQTASTTEEGSSDPTTSTTEEGFSGPTTSTTTEKSPDNSGVTGLSAFSPNSGMISLVLLLVLTNY